MTRALEFDPLVEFYGMWTTGLADRYLPLSYAPLVGKYECVDGHLVMSRRGNSGISYASGALSGLLRDPAHAAGHSAYLSLDVTFDPCTWIEPDLVVLKESAQGLDWVPADLMVLPIEFGAVSERVDQRALCEKAGVPFFMRVEIDDDEVHVELFRLDNGKYVVHAKALTGQRFETEVPFPISFDPVVLLEP